MPIPPVALWLSAGRDAHLQVNASNNAGDTPWHTAQTMGHEAAMRTLEKVHGLPLGVFFLVFSVFI